MLEIWKPIAGYEGLYEVSNLGRVKSFERPNTKGGILKTTKNNRGYHDVSLMKCGKRKHQLVHRLVAIAFCEKPEGTNVVNHIDCNPDNNCASNLEWVTQSQNICHSADCGKMVRPVIRSNGKTEKYYQSMKEAQRDGFCVSAISQCCHGKTKTHKGYKWRYAE